MESILRTNGMKANSYPFLWSERNGIISMMMNISISGPGMRCIFMKIFPGIVCMCWSIQRINGISTAIMPASWMISFMASV